MNCIFLCVFFQEDYVKLLLLLLESIFIYGNLDDNTEIVVYTSLEFMNKIKQSNLYNQDKIKFVINDTYNTIDRACKARLDVFKLPLIENYDKILYLDTDIIIKGDINAVFDICRDDVIYALEEGTIDDPDDFWGKTLFTDEELSMYEDKSAFTTGILLFNNSLTLKDFFDKVNIDASIRSNSFHDQGYLIYNAFRYNLYENKTLKSLAINRSDDVNSDKTIFHFAGGPGYPSGKLTAMTDFLKRAKDITIMNCINETKEYINKYLLPIIFNCGEKLEGNIFMVHHTTDYSDVFLDKCKNISSLVLNKNIKNVMEIGFNSGFSTLLMLISNPKLRVTCFDLGEHRYTLPCFKQIRETFGYDRVQIIIGDSAKTLPKVSISPNTPFDRYFDLVHIDGCHNPNIAKSDIENSYRLSKSGTILIMDDYDCHDLKQLWDHFINYYKLKPLDIQLYDSPYHDIKFIP